MLVIDVYLYVVLLPLFQSEKIAKLVMNIVVYPLGMFFLWMPTFLVLVSIQLDANVNEAKNIQFINSLLTDLAAMYGLFLSIVFFWKSEESRQRWRLLFNKWGLCGKAKKKAMSSVESISSIRSISGYEDDRKTEQRPDNMNIAGLGIDMDAGDNVSDTEDNDVGENYNYAEKIETTNTTRGRSTASATYSSRRSSRTPSVLRTINEYNGAISSDFESDGVYLQAEVRVLRPSEDVRRSRASSKSSSGRVSRILSFGRRSSTGSTGGSSISSITISSSGASSHSAGSAVPARLSAAVEAPDGHERDSVL